MRKWTTIFLIIMIFVFQFSVLGTFMSSGRVPNLFIAFVVSIVVLFGFKKSLPWILLSGLLMDVGSSWLIGSGTLVLVLIAWLIDKLKIIAELRSKRYLFAFLLALIFVAASLFFDFFIQFWINLEKQLSLNNAGFFELNVNLDYMIKLFYSVIFGIAVYYFVRKIKTQNVGIFIKK